MTRKRSSEFLDTSVKIFSYITTEKFYLRDIQEPGWTRASKTLCTPLIIGLLVGMNSSCIKTFISLHGLHNTQYITICPCLRLNDRFEMMLSENQTELTSY